MKSLKALGAIVLAAAALSLLSASDASATVLCTNSGCTTVYPSSTEVTYTLKSGTSAILETTEGTTIATCTGSTVSGKTSSESGTSISSTIESLAWSGCSQTTDTVKNGSFSITWTSGGNGTVVGSSSEVTLSIFGASCVYGTSTGTTLGTLTGGETPELPINAVLPKISGSFLCPATGRWTATFVVTSPHALFVGKEKGSEPTSTSLTTSLSGESKSGEEITVNEGSKVKDTATLSGTNASKATGTVKYKLYADKECKELVTSAGEVTVSEGKVPASEEKTLEAARVYYWQAEYSGDTNNLKSTSTCGKEVLTVKAATSLTTLLFGDNPESIEPVEGEEITVSEGSAVGDSATLSGTKSSTATGKVSFKVYANSECKELVAEAGEANVEEGSVDPSEEVELKEKGTYYWQANYEGDSLHQASTSTCGEVVHVNATTFIFRSDATSTTFTGEGTGEEEQLLKTTAGTISCETVTYVGSQIGAEASEFDAEPTYSGCTAFGSSAEVKTNGCKYVFTADTFKEGTFIGSMDIVCPEGQEIVVTASTCTVDIPAQNGLNTITYSNTGEAPPALTANIALSGVKYTQTGSGGGSCATTTDENGTRESVAVFQGESEREGELEDVGISSDHAATLITIRPLLWNFPNKGSVKNYTIYNEHAIVRYINSIEVVDITEKVDETDFEVVKPVPCIGGLNATEICTFTVKFTSGVKPKIRWLRVTWGGWWPWSVVHKRKVDLFAKK